MKLALIKSFITTLLVGLSCGYIYLTFLILGKYSDNPLVFNTVVLAQLFIFIFLIEYFNPSESKSSNES